MSLTNLPPVYQTERITQLKKDLEYNHGTRKKLENFSYGLNDIIGKGYSSQVFKGKNDVTNQPVAIKVIDIKMLKCEVNRILLNNQIQNLKLLSKSNNILELLEVYNTKNNTYIITELCQTDLSKIIKNKLNQKQAFGYIQQLIQGYLNLYRNQIIHRDLKPANLLIKDGILKIADLGFSINQKEALKPSKYNVGSPLYMAPQSLKKNQYSFKSDIWALGVIFYEMIFSITPWRAKNEKELLKKIESQDIKTLLAQNVNPIVREFLLKTLCIQKQTRLSPQQLGKFNFNIQPTLEINKNVYLNTKVLKQKSLNQKVNYSIRLNSETDHHTSLGEYVTPKTKFFVKGNQIQNQQMKSKDQNITVCEISKESRRQITKILISQIHFCRFLYKLIERIRKQPTIKMFNQQLENQYIGVIMQKIIKVKDFKYLNYINVQQYEHYKKTNDFGKIRKIAQQYQCRYQQQLNIEFKMFKYDVSKIMKLTEKAIKALAKDLGQKINNNNIQVYANSVIILDYLITALQLFEIMKGKQDYKLFAKESKIEQIVEGVPKIIIKSHFDKILERIEILKL